MQAPLAVSSSGRMAGGAAPAAADGLRLPPGRLPQVPEPQWIEDFLFVIHPNTSQQLTLTLRQARALRFPNFSERRRSGQLHLLRPEPLAAQRCQAGCTCWPCCRQPACGRAGALPLRRGCARPAKQRADCGPPCTPQATWARSR
jgi:hypothetical protein